MLATLGFLTAAILLILFSYTFADLVKTKHQELRLFGLAYFLVALAFLMWGALSFGNAASLLPKSVLVGDALIMAASVCSLLVFAPPKFKNLVIAGGVVLAVVLLFLRAKYYYPVPYLRDGVLFFNTQRPVAVLISVIVVAAWLPACLKVAATITANSLLRRFYSLYVTAYALTIITAALFIQARRRTIVIEAFTGFAVSVLVLLLSNLLAKNTKTAKVRHAA